MQGADTSRHALDAFERARPALLGLAYRILGSHADAEDAVQDTFLKWQADDRGDIANPTAWLATVCTRHCLDLLRHHDRSRVDYVGTWLPEPLHTAEEDGPDHVSALSASLTTAFVLALQRLTPKERAAFLLREIFDMAYADVARMLDLSEAACRQLVARARGHVEQAKVRHSTPAAQQRRLLAAFRDAIATGSVDALASLLSADVRLAADGGGKVAAARRVMRGRHEVLRFIQAGLHVWWAGSELHETGLNGGRGLLQYEHGRVVAAVSFGYDEDGRLSDIFIVRNPDKLQRLEQARVV